VRVDHDVVAEELEAVLVVGQQILHRFETVHEDLLNLQEALVDEVCSELGGQEELEVSELPLAVVAVLVLLVALLHSDVRAVDICSLAGTFVFDVVHGEPLVRKARESCAVEVDGQRVETRAEGVESEVELLPSDEQWIGDVLLRDVVFLLESVADYDAGVLGAPLVDCAQLVDQEDAFALASACRLHDPEDVRVPGELFFEERELFGHLVGLGEEPHGQVVGGGGVFFERLAVALEVLGQVVFSGELGERGVPLCGS